MDFIGDQGEKYIVPFTDVGSRYTFFMPVRRRCDALNAIFASFNYKNTTFGAPRLLHTDKSKDFSSLAVKKATRAVAIAIRTTIPQNPEENGLAKWVNRTLMNCKRGILSTANMPQAYWSYGVRDMVFKQTPMVHHRTSGCHAVPSMAWLPRQTAQNVFLWLIGLNSHTTTERETDRPQFYGALHGDVVYDACDDTAAQCTKFKIQINVLPPNLAGHRPYTNP